MTSLGDVVAQCEELLDTIKNGALDAMQADFNTLKTSLTQAISQVNGAIPTAVTSTVFKTVWVDPAGDDATGDGSKDKPYQTITQTIERFGQGVYLEIILTPGAEYTEAELLSNVNRRWVLIKAYGEPATINITAAGTWLAAGVLWYASYNVNVILSPGARLAGFRNNTGAINGHITLFLGGTYTWDGELTSGGGGHLTLRLAGTFQSTNPATIMPIIGSGYSSIAFSAPYAVTRWPAGNAWRDFLNVRGAGYNSIITDEDIDA